MRLIASAIILTALSVVPVTVHAQTAPTVINSTDFSSLKPKLAEVKCTVAIDYRGADASIKVGIITCDNPEDFTNHFTIGDKMFLDPPTPASVNQKFVFTVKAKKNS